MSEKFPYEDIVDLPAHISKKHPQPTAEERAARFAPFAAISGYEEMVLEEARVTDDTPELDEDALIVINEKLNIIKTFTDKIHGVKITYFEKDKKKKGGSYKIICGRVKHIDEYSKTVIMTDGTKIDINMIYEVEISKF